MLQELPNIKSKYEIVYNTVGAVSSQEDKEAVRSEEKKRNKYIYSKYIYI